MTHADLELPRRKRKLRQMLKAFPGSGLGFSNQESGTKVSRGQVSNASSSSCLLSRVESAESFGGNIGVDSHSSNSLLTFEDHSPEKPMCSESPLAGEAINLNSPCKDAILLVYSDESVSCSNPIRPENITSLEEVPSLNLDDTGHSSNSAILDSPSQKHLQSPLRSGRLSNTIDDDGDGEKMVVPVGPRFQADVPDWTGPQNCEDSDSRRFVGTRIWSVEGGSTRNAPRPVGQGRPETCSCLSPDSAECIRRHIIEERLHILCDLGTAFFRLKLDSTGEQVAKTWTSGEQHNFDLRNHHPVGRTW